MFELRASKGRSLQVAEGKTVGCEWLPSRGNDYSFPFRRNRQGLGILDNNYEIEVMLKKKIEKKYSGQGPFYALSLRKVFFIRYSAILDVMFNDDYYKLGKIAKINNCCKARKYGLIGSIPQRRNITYKGVTHRRDDGLETRFGGTVPCLDEG